MRPFKDSKATVFMISRRSLAAFAAILAFAGVGAPAGAAQRPDRAVVQAAPSRVNDHQVEQLLTRINKDADRFRSSLGAALDRSRLDGSREETAMKQTLRDFAQATKQLRERFGGSVAVTTEVNDVLQRGAGIETFMQQHTLADQATADWRTVRGGLDQLARAYDVTWNQTLPSSVGGRPRAASDRRLSGTYRLERDRGDDPVKAVERATRSVSSSQRQVTRQRLIARLTSPDVIAIDRTGRRITIASSQGPRLSFDADGQSRSEQGASGRSVNTRATLQGDRLEVTTDGTGNEGRNFDVTFEPIGGGSGLLVTRRIYDGSLRQPVSVQSFYQRSSAEAEWDGVTVARRAAIRGGARSSESRDELGVPADTRLVGTLDTDLNTRDTRAEDRFTITMSSPVQYQGAVIEGSVASVNQSGLVTGRSDMALTFERIRTREGRTYPFTGTIDGVRTADGSTIRVDSEGTVEGESQSGQTVRRGAIGAGLGAIIGAIAGGGSGAAIGAAIGAGGGAGTVAVQGRDQLDLPRGTELSIISGTY